MGKSKADLADAVYRRHGGLTRRDAVGLVDLVFGRIGTRLAGGDAVRIHGFGTFRVVTRRARLGRNPKTGAVVPIAAARRAAFRPSRLMIRDLNGRGEG
jgi:integration host factor subunit alpha